MYRLGTTANIRFAIARDIPTHTIDNNNTWRHRTVDMSRHTVDGRWHGRSYAQPCPPAPETVTVVGRTTVFRAKDQKGETETSQTGQCYPRPQRTKGQDDGLACTTYRAYYLMAPTTTEPSDTHTASHRENANVFFGTRDFTVNDTNASTRERQK